MSSLEKRRIMIETVYRSWGLPCDAKGLAKQTINMNQDKVVDYLWKDLRKIIV